MNPKLNIEQLAEFLAGRASPELASKLRRELTSPDADGRQFLVALDEAEHDPLAVDWSRLDEPATTGRQLPESTPGQGAGTGAIPTVQRATALPCSPGAGSRSVTRWLMTVAVGVASGLAAVAAVAGFEEVNRWPVFGSKSEARTAPERPLTAVTFAVAQQQAESLAPAGAAKAESGRSPSELAPLELSQETRLTGLQIREQLAATSFAP